MLLITSNKTGKIRLVERWAASHRERSLDIKVPDETLPGGWILLRGLLNRRGGDCGARLYCDLGSGRMDDNYFDIPTSAKGVINELIYLPAGIRNMRFSLLAQIAKDGRVCAAL